MRFPKLMISIGITLLISAGGVIYIQYGYINHLQNKYQHASDNVLALTEKILLIEKQAAIVADTMAIHKNKSRQLQEKAYATRKILRDIEINDYCADQLVPADILRVQYETISSGALPVSDYSTEPADALPDSES
ncbi:hypothetical protein [Serratia proteamaculans]|uniref:DUF2570 domain-containing protein n=1 Tax=Serratia proteamaculans TaxID=28151 RepID=A0A5Q2V8H5_SERPR|nr:hypothetical protein [Serratia proteamaculans]QGH60546.1 hypothetical protein GHV41_06690 [Serratia proteamaculans]